MANTTTTTGQPTSWTDFYESKRSEIASLKAVYVESFETLAEMTLEMKTGADLAITIASRTYNFLILTGEANSINLLHHCYNTTKTGNASGVVIGIHGTRKTAPFKAFDPAHAVSTLQPPRPKKKDKKSKLFVPSLEMFSTAKTKR
jgi:hypothetical protein